MQTAEHGSGFSFQLCGRAAISDGHGRRAMLPRKAMALLAYLLVEPGPHSRAHLAALLWPESDETHAAMSLRQALRSLRDVLGTTLEADRQWVSLGDPDFTLAASCDVLRFEALLSHDVAQACAVDVHRFLEQCVVDDAPEFVHWCDRTRAGLVRSAVKALAECAQDLRVQQDWRQLLAVGERWLAIDPLSVDAACTAIEAVFLRRDSAQALALRDRYLQTLAQEELGDSPAAGRVRELVQRFESVTGASPLTGVPAAKADVRDRHQAGAGALEGGILERHDGWRLVLDAFSETVGGGASQWLTVAGGIGAGRSRFLQDVAVMLLQRGATVMTTGAPSHQPRVPFGAVTQLVRSVVREDALAGVDEAHLRTLHTLVPELADHFAMLRRSGNGNGTGADGVFGLRLQDALTQALMALCEDHPLVVVLDDAMWYDRESTDTLRVVAQRASALPILWLVTDADDALQERENPSWAEFVRGGVRIPLPPLSVAAIERLLADMSGIEGGWASLAQCLHDGSHGMPGSVLAVLHTLTERWGAPDVTWQRQACADVPLATPSPRVRAYIDALDDVTRTVLLSLALILEHGHPIPAAQWPGCPVLTPEQLSHIHGISRLRAAIVGERLVEARLAEECQGGFRCVSPVLVGYMLGTGSALVRDELRALVSRYLGHAPSAIRCSPTPRAAEHTGPPL